MRINDPAHVARQYASEANLEARSSLYADAEGPDPRQIAFDAVAEVAPNTRENGAEIIGRHFDRVECGDADGWVTIVDHETVRGFVASLDGGEPDELPPYDLPLRSRRASSVFVASGPRA